MAAGPSGSVAGRRKKMKAKTIKQIINVESIMKTMCENGGKLRSTDEEKAHTECATENCNAENINLYHASDKGPFFVHIESAAINPIGIGAKLKKAGFFDFVDIKKINKRCVKVHTKSGNAANKIVTLFAIDEHECYIPAFYTCIEGIVKGVPTEYSDAEILDDITSEYANGQIFVQHVERLQRWDAETQTKIPTTIVKIAFRSQRLPEKLKLFGVKTNVTLYEKKPMQCRTCMKYGHSYKRCSSEKICNRCLGTDHDKSACKNDMKCLYCKDETDHTTLDRQCPERKRQQEITNLMATDRITYREAILKQKAANESQFPPLNGGRNSYSEVVSFREEINDMKKNLKEKDEKIEILNNMVAKKNAQIEELFRLLEEERNKNCDKTKTENSTTNEARQQQTNEKQQTQQHSSQKQVKSIKQSQQTTTNKQTTEPQQSTQSKMNSQQQKTQHLQTTAKNINKPKPTQTPITQILKKHKIEEQQSHDNQNIHHTNMEMDPENINKEDIHENLKMDEEQTDFTGFEKNLIEVTPKQ